MSTQNFHASCVAIGEFGLLIRGASGRGKSDLVLRLLDEARGASLVADDQVIIVEEDGVLIASAPVTLAGKLEIRGQGIVAWPHLAQVKLSHIIDLVEQAEISRMPEVSELQTSLMNHVFPRLKLDGKQASAPARVRAFLQR